MGKGELEFVSVERSTTRTVTLVLLFKISQNFYSEETFKNILKEMRMKKIKENLIYLKKRNGLISLINKLTKLHKFNISSFYLAIIYLDTIFLNGNVLDKNLDMDLIAVCCLLIASKIF